MQAFDSGVLFLVVAAFIAYLTRTGKRENGLPPGPPTLPVLGNILSFPREYVYLKLSEWATEYGGIYSLKLGSGTMIVLSSATTVEELLDQRSAYSIDRPDSHLAQIVSDGLHFAFARYGSWDWRVLRKGAHTVLTPQAAARHIPIQQAEATQLMYDLMREPDAILNHVRRYANSVISSVIVGKRSPRFESEHACMFFEYDERWDAYLAPGASPPVDMFPILKYLPEFLAPWKKEARALRRLQRQLFFTALEECEERLQRGEGNDCYLEELIQQKDEIGLSRDQIALVPSRRGCSGTSAIFLKSLILALITYPEVQRKAQEEIDTIVGHERTPMLADYDSLPYIRASFKKYVHRTRPVAPLTIPHATTVVQEYRGYVIPKGATIFLNAWGIYHDPDAFDEPEAFNPDRSIKSLYGTKDGYDDTDFRNNFGFGSGRRICPGQVLANNSIAINVMNLIWAFNFVPPSNNRGGKPYDIENYLSGLSCTPRPFECTIVPRSAAKKRMIEREFSDAIRVFENFESTLTSDDKEYIRATRTSR
ncbi:cytochrome P450 [Hymenopellis radicata]|nr:cytochrome P450 [Hymenopellis radicata]